MIRKNKIKNLINSVLFGNNLWVLKRFPDNSIGSMVTDCPYGISFMNKKWDLEIPSIEQWKECFRVLKPGSHILVFVGTKKNHRIVCNIEDAGFEILTHIPWIHAQGVPKNYDISKEIYMSKKFTNKSNDKYKGLGTALSPCCELILFARKPISEKNIIENIFKWGVGGINIDISCIPGRKNVVINSHSGYDSFSLNESTKGKWSGNKKETKKGLFPKNVIFDQFMADELDSQSGEKVSGSISKKHKQGDIYGYKYNIVFGEPYVKNNKSEKSNL